MLEVKTWDIGPGLVAILTALMGLVSVWLAKIHRIVNHTAASLAEIAKEREKSLRDAELKIAKLEAAVSVAAAIKDSEDRASVIAHMAMISKGSE